MLYIASALAPTPVLHSLVIDDFTAKGSSSLITARPDRIEVWDITPDGLVPRGELKIWGSVAGIAKAVVKDAAPHLLILTAPPSARLLLVAFSPTPSPSLVVTSSNELRPPTPSLRLAEFFTGVISRDTAVIVSLWVGVLSCIEIEIEKDKDVKKRRASNVAVADPEGVTRLQIKTNFNINIREHNLLHLAFAPESAPSGEHILAFLYQTSTSDLLLQARTLSASRAFADLSAPVNVMLPRSTGVTLDDSTDFQELPFSCPAARRVVPIPSPVGLRTFLVIGDEYSVLWQLNDRPPTRPRRTSASSGPATSPRASNTRRSPQAEMTGSIGKRRKSSMTGSVSENDQRWTLSPLWRVRQGFGTVLASAVLDAHADGATALFGDESGRLTRVIWETVRADPSFSPSFSTTVVKTDLGICAPPSSLTPLGGAHLFLASACGDSAVLRLPDYSSLLDPASSMCSSPTRSTPRAIPGSARKGKGRSRIDDADGVNVERVEEEDFAMEIRERWMNLAPVKDLCIVEEEGGGLSHLVVASGASCSNSLRAIRSGVGIETILEVSGLDGVERMWQIDQPEGPALLLSTASSTVLLHIHPRMEIAPIPDEIAQSPTLAACSLPNALTLVTPRGVFSMNSLGETSVSSWTCAQGRQINAGAVTGSLVVLAVPGNELVILEADPTGVRQLVSYRAPAEIASLNVYAGENVPSPIIAVATWTRKILLYTLSNLGSTDILATTISEQAFSSSLHLRRSLGASVQTSSVQLIAGLSDGSMISYRLDQAEEGGGLVVSDRKASSLGVRPLRVQAVAGLKDGDDDIFAVGLTERMSVVFESRGRVEFSSVAKRGVTAACSVSVPSLGTCLAMASASGLSFTKITSLKKLHVQTLDLGNRSAAKVVNLPEANALAVGAAERKLDRSTGDIRQTSFLELRERSSFDLLTEIKLQQREIVSSLSHVVLEGRPYLCVGIALLSEADEGMDDLADQALISAQSGRIALYAATPSATGEMELRWVAQVLTDGAVHDSKVIFGFLAVAAGSKVTLYRFDPRGGKLVVASTFSSAFVARSLFVASASKLHADKRLIIGDGMRSLLSLEIDPDTGEINGDRRDMATHCIVAMEGIKDGGQAVVVADAHSNILTFRLQERPEQAAVFGLHEDVAQFAQGSLAPASSAPELIAPDVLFATLDGRIGIIGELTPFAAKTLDGLQRNMDKLHKGPGRIGWRIWRQGGKQLANLDTAGFIDGDFVEQFLDSDVISDEEAEAILAGGSAPERIMKINQAGGIEPATRREVTRILEGVSGLH